jgi:D-alanine transaminase
MMQRTVYVNGVFLPEDQATVSIFDRGFLMADGVYEVTAVLGGRLVDFAGHCQRLARSLDALEINCSYTPEQWLDIHRQLIALNSLQEGMVYLQVTRGNPRDRSFRYPPPGTPPTVVLFTQSLPTMRDTPEAEVGWRVISVADLRWGRRDIKTVQLLYPSMGKMLAQKAGADDAWFVEDGYITEGTSNNAYIILSGNLVTRPLSNDILHGITRQAVLQLARETGIQVIEGNFTLEEAYTAEEAFVTSATAFVMPVVSIDGQTIGSGQPGPHTQRLRQIYIEAMQQSAI